MGQMVPGGLNFDNTCGTVGFNKGRHYWEYRVVSMLDERSIFIGVTSSPACVLQSATPGVWRTIGTYGWHCSQGILQWIDPDSREEERIPYGDMCD